MKATHLLLFAAVTIAAWATMGLGQDAPAPAPAPGAAASPLGVRQENVRRMVSEMEAKFSRLAEVLRDSEPERATRLADALSASREQRIGDRMQRIESMLDKGQLELAQAEQDRIVSDLTNLIDILTDEGELDELLDEADRLERIRQRIDDLIETEKGLRDETDKLENKDQVLESLEAQIEAVKNLIAGQTAARDAAAAARTKGLGAMSKAAEEQARVRKQTQDALKKMAGKQANAEGQSEGQGGGERQGEGEGQGMESGASGKPQPNGPGAKPMQRAVDHQRRAEKDLDQGKGRGALAEQDEAIKQLKKTLEELEKERRRIGRLDKEKDAERLADDQERAADKAGDLAKDMEGGGKGEGQGGKPAGEGEPQPGRQNVAQAQKTMQQAARSLDKKDTGKAGKQQDEAIKELEQARQDVEERLRQLREEMQQEILAALEARFRQMLLRQQPVTEMTAKLDAARADGVLDSDGNRVLSRAQEVQLKQLAEEERALAAMAREALEIITEDGTTVVFPRIVGGLVEDLEAVSRFLDRQETGKYPRQMQLEIEATLHELIEALEKAQEQQEAQEGQAAQQGETDPPLPPLVPGSAELKLLKSAQLRVNRRTTAFDEARPAALSAPLQREVQRISERQDEVRQMAVDMAEGPS